MLCCTQILAADVEHFSARLEEEQASFHDLLEERMAASTAQVRAWILLWRAAVFKAGGA